MAQTPQFLGPDGVYRSDYSYSTTVESQFLSGTIDPDTVFMQISIFGQPFVDDPDLVTFEGSVFQIPNPSKYPEGLRIFPGENNIQVRSITTTGEVSTPAEVRIRLLQDSDLGVVADAPTGIRIERQDQTVKITLNGLTVDPNVQGYNYYCTTQPGGGTIGYSRINPTMVTDPDDVTENLTTLGTLEVDSRVAVDSNGDALADPLMFRVTGDQEDRTGEVIQADFNQRLEIPESASQFRSTVQVDQVDQVFYYAFTHQRAAGFTSANPAVPNGDFAATPNTDPLYYAATAVYYDPDNRTQFESPFSIEVPGAPLTVTPVVGGLPEVTRQIIVRDTVSAIYRSNDQIRVDPGSVERDVFIDPFSSEAERLRFIMDFLHRAQSFSTLLEIDDPNNTGFSIPVQQSSYKLALGQAFHMRDVRQVQTLIDMAFDKLASNRGIVRKTGKRSRGEVTFFLTSRPTKSYTIAIGTDMPAGSYTARTTSSSVIDAGNIAQYYDATTGTYRVKSYARMTASGASGNISTGQIRTVPRLPELNVTNEDAFFGGTDQETNRQLAVRCDYKLASVDSGTRWGYWQTVADIAGVEEVQIVQAGNALMERDYDTDYQKHTGGKVDIWVRGEQESSVTDTFAFAFETKYDVVFEPWGNPQDLIFRAVDQALSPENPIIEMLDCPTCLPPAGMRNATTGKEFVLTGVQYLSYDTIQLDAQSNDPNDIGVTDIVTGDYRYRTSSDFTLLRQPVIEVTEMVGQTGYTGTLDPSLYTLYRLDSPLLLGRSSEDTAFVRVSSDQQIGNVLTVPDEDHIILAFEIEYLDFLGVNVLTIVITNDDGSVTYSGPGTIAPDYRIIDSTDNQTPVGIQRTETSTIPSGSIILVTYEHDENFTIAYTTNSIIGVVQNALANFRHITADVLAKWALQSAINLAGTVVLKPGTGNTAQVTKDQVDKDIRTRITNLFNGLGMSDAVHPSDVIAAIEAAVRVDYVVTPLTLMARADDSMVLMEFLDTSESNDLFKVESWSSDTVDVYLVLDPLNSSTTTGGGPTNEYRSVFQDETRLTIIDTVPNSAGVPVNQAVGNAFIIGNGGLVIPDYNDDVTLQLLYPTMTEDQRAEEARIMSANRVVLTVETTDSPTEHSYNVTYWVEGDDSVGSIRPATVEYLVPGDLNFIYDEEAIA